MVLIISQGPNVIATNQSLQSEQATNVSKAQLLTLFDTNLQLIFKTSWYNFYNIFNCNFIHT